jgi:hypothetical protein
MVDDSNDSGSEISRAADPGATNGPERPALNGEIDLVQGSGLSSITTDVTKGWRRYPDTGIRNKLPEALERSVKSFVTDHGWKKVKFATGFNADGDRVIHPVFQTNKGYIDSLFKITGLTVKESGEGHKSRAKYEEALMTYFEASIANTRSNKIGALKKAYYSK